MAARLPPSEPAPLDEPAAPEPRSPDSSGGGASARVSLRSLFKGFAPLLALGGLFLLKVPICPSRWLFGVPCPGCGLTRASAALVTGHWSAAMAFHPLAPILAPIFGWMLLRTALVSARVLRPGSHDPFSRLPTWFWALLLVLLIGVWVARLLGGLGGLPDPVAPEDGLLGHLLRFLVGLLR